MTSKKVPQSVPVCRNGSPALLGWKDVAPGASRLTKIRPCADADPQNDRPPAHTLPRSSAARIGSPPGNSVFVPLGVLKLVGKSGLDQCAPPSLETWTPPLPLPPMSLP